MTIENERITPLLAGMDPVYFSSVSGAETPALRHGEEAPSPFCVRSCLQTAGPAGIDAGGAAAIPQAPLRVYDWRGWPIQQ